MNVNFGNNLYDDDDFPAPPPDLVVKEVINSRKYSGNRPLSGLHHPPDLKVRIGYCSNVSFIFLSPRHQLGSYLARCAIFLEKLKHQITQLHWLSELHTHTQRFVYGKVCLLARLIHYFFLFAQSFYYFELENCELENQRNRKL